MANFQIALERTLRFEDPTLSGVRTHDDGGFTRFGISENANPEVFPEMLTCTTERALEIAGEIYREKYWHFDGVNDQDVANKLFDLSVNCGPSTAIYFCQKAVGTTPDGAWGPRTEFAVNETKVDLLQALRNDAAQYYQDLVARNPDKYGQYLNGWLKRAAA